MVSETLSWGQRIPINEYERQVTWLGERGGLCRTRMFYVAFGPALSGSVPSLL